MHQPFNIYHYMSIVNVVPRRRKTTARNFNLCYGLWATCPSISISLLVYLSIYLSLSLWFSTVRLIVFVCANLLRSGSKHEWQIKQINSINADKNTTNPKQFRKCIESVTIHQKKIKRIKICWLYQIVAQTIYVVHAQTHNHTTKQSHEHTDCQLYVHLVLCTGRCTWISTIRSHTQSSFRESKAVYVRATGKHMTSSAVFELMLSRSCASRQKNAPSEPSEPSVLCWSSIVLICCSVECVALFWGLSNVYTIMCSAGTSLKIVLTICNIVE